MFLVFILPRHDRVWKLVGRHAAIGAAAEDAYGADVGLDAKWAIAREGEGRPYAISADVRGQEIADLRRGIQTGRFLDTVAPQTAPPSGIPLGHAPELDRL